MIETEYFNYISFYNEKFVTGDTSSLSMTIDRVLEYTPSDIFSRLAGLKPSALRFIASLPTFICSEIDGDRMYIKFGRIRNLNVKHRELEFSFEAETDFGYIDFENVKEAAEIFSAHSFQPYRTHWAVMAGKSEQIVRRLIQKKPGAAPAQVQEVSDSEPPPAEEQVETAASVEDFLKIVFSFTNDPDLEYFFRGHELSSFSLVPSVMRAWEKGAPKFLPNEDRMAKELLIAHYDEFQTDQFRFDQLVRMQHFGLPTRLLDLTGNPLIALYFACEKAPHEQGQVVIFGVKKDLIKYFDSDTVSCLSNLSKLTSAEKDAIDLSLNKDQFNKTPSIKQLLHHIRSEKGYFEARVDPSHIGSIICVKGKRNNIRIKSQHGAFLLFGHGAKMPPEGIDGISVRRINIISKTGILDQLDGINISASTVYPSMDKSTDQIKAQYVLPEN